MSNRKRVEAVAIEPQAVEVGELVELERGAVRLAVLPDGTVVTCGRGYQVRHEGRHVIGGVEYDVTDPRKAKAELVEDADQGEV